MQEKPPFGSYFDFFPNVWEGDTPSHTHPLRTLILPSGTPLILTYQTLASKAILPTNKVKGCTSIFSIVKIYIISI